MSASIRSILLPRDPSANLFLGVVTAAVGLVWGIAAQMGTTLSPELAGIVIAFLGAVIALLAANDNLAVAKGKAASIRLADKG